MKKILNLHHFNTVALFATGVVDGEHCDNDRQRCFKCRNIYIYLFSFIYLVQTFADVDPRATQKEKVQHDKALEVYQAAYESTRKNEHSCLTGLKQTLK